MKPPRILIVDDHFVVRQGVEKILRVAFPDSVIAEAGSAQEALDHIWNSEWNVAILDINMPGRGGLDLLRTIKQEYPKTAVIVFTMCPEDQFAVRVLRHGASSYLTKESAGPELVAAIQAALAGKKYISRSVAEKLAQHVEQDETEAPHESLSDREYRVMCMIAAGRTVKEIAAELFLSVKTVSTYRSRLLEKMNLANNAEIMRYAVQKGLVDINTGETSAPRPDRGLTR